MGRLYEQYKVWMPWRWVPIGIFLAIMYSAAGVFYLRDGFKTGLEALGERRAARRRALPTLAPAAGTPATAGGEETARVAPIRVKVFAKGVAGPETEEIAEEAEEEEEAKVAERYARGM